MKRKIIEISIVLAAFVLVIAGVAGYLVLTTGGAKIVFHQGIDRYLAHNNFSWSDFQGNLWRGVMIRDLELRDVRGVREEGHVIRVQDLTMGMKAWGLAGIRIDFYNARLLSRRDEPVVAEGRIEGARIAANVYARTFDLLRIKEFVPAFRHLAVIKGSLRDVDVALQGTLQDVHVAGRLGIERWRYAKYLLENCEVEEDLRLVKSPLRWQVYGKVVIVSGHFLTPHVKVQLRRSRLDFNGSLLNPSLDIKGQARVARTKIDIVIRGTREKPQVFLSSEDGVAQEQLLLMLTTGKRWNSVKNASFQKGMTPEVATDFVDYFIFGGSGKSLSQYLGLSDVSVHFDERKRGVSLSKDVTDRIGLGYGVEMETPQDEPATFKQQVLGEYDVTDRVTLGVQKEIAAPADPKLKGQIPDKPVDDRVYMKYQTKF